ncbi:MAG: ribonuclease T2 [Acidobacteriota bacterium]|nr:ribonuclease T2 [Acidobacteriota bacterium]
MQKILVIVVLVICCVSLAKARGHRRHNQSQQDQQHQGQPGVFDYYVLTMSWSPEFCHGHAESPECQSGHYGFIAHGLWPQYTHGYPEHCGDSAGLSNPSAMLDIMPDVKLIQHEWTTHGTCSGLSAEEYFKRLRTAYTAVKIPAKLIAPAESFSIPPDELKKSFLEANSKLSNESLAISCGNNYLTGIHVCLTKDLQPTACTDIRDCRANMIKVPPIR